MKKIVLITGANRGIGKATAIEFEKNGYKVIVNYRKQINQDEFVGDFDFVKADITNDNEINAMYNTIKNRYGSIDVLVNNAGIVFDRDFKKIKENEFFETIKTNVYAPFNLSRLFSTIMSKGSIVNLSSTNGTKTISPECLDYNISKIGLQSLTRDLAYQLKPNIRVNAVAPGWVDTDMNKDLSEEYIKSEFDKIFLERFARSDEIAKLIYFLASDDSSYINGEVINIDGGM